MIEKDILYFMQFAFSLAKTAFEYNEVPVGAVIVKDRKIIGRGYNQVIQNISVSSHAEINAINDASKNIGNYRLNNCDLFVTLEPCHMCAKAIVDARIRNLYFGAREPKTGAIESIDYFLSREDLNHQVNFKGGLMSIDSSELLRKFFQSKRN
jgi:tRNA(adenine34) deaminase